MSIFRQDYLFDPAKPGSYPELLRPVLTLHGADPDGVLLLMRTDLDPDCLPVDCWLFADGKTLYRLCGVVEIQNRKERPLSAGNNYRVFKETGFFSQPLDGLSDFRVEELASSARMTAVRDGCKITVANLSFSFREDALHFCSYMNELLENGSFTPKSGADAEKRELFCPKCGLRYADPERKLCPHCMKRTRLVRRTASLFRNYKVKLAFLILLLVLTGALAVIAPYFSTKLLYDEVLEQGGAFYGKLAAIILLIVLTRVATQLVNALHSGVSSFVAADMIYDLRKAIFSSVNRLSYGFFTSRKTGGLMTQVNSDSNTIYWFFCENIPFIAVNLAQIVAVTVVMLLLSPPLCLAAILILPPAVIGARFIFKKLHVLHGRRFGKNSSMNAALSDMLGGARVVKAFSAENNERKRFEKKSEELASADLKTSLYGARAFPAVRVLLDLGNILVWALGGAMILLHYTNPALAGERAVLTYGTLAAFLNYVSMVFSPVFTMVDMTSAAADSMNAMGRLVEIMDAKQEVTEKEDCVCPDHIDGAVTFEDVSFEYIPAKPVLEHVSFTLEAGKTLGIVGRTGAGKTTLVNLLLRLYDPTSGRILVDGTDLRDLSFESLRKNVAAVSQDTYLFSGTIFDNVRYARPDASPEEVFDACVAAGANEFIMKLRDGYETKIGQGNADLSGGERQRLSIARAILKDPKILILDEATASMDTRTERIIQRSISSLTKDRTTLIIAHRLSTLRNADSLIVLDDRTIVEEGTPEELLREKGLYFRLCKMQSDALKAVGIAED